jgi:hypothetical protein
MLQRSLVFVRIAEENAPECNIEINVHHYEMAYYVVDGIYP